MSHAAHAHGDSHAAPTPTPVVVHEPPPLPSAFARRKTSEVIGATIALVLTIFAISTYFGVNAAIAVTFALAIIGFFRLQGTREMDQAQRFFMATVVGLAAQLVLSQLNPATTDAWSLGSFQWIDFTGAVVALSAAYVWYNAPKRFPRLGAVYITAWVMIISALVNAIWPAFDLGRTFPLFVFGVISLVPPKETPISWVFRTIGRVLIFGALLSATHSAAVIFSTPKKGEAATPIQDLVAVGLVVVDDLATGGIGKLSSVINGIFGEDNEPLVFPKDCAVLIDIQMSTADLTAYRGTFIAKGILPRRVVAILTGGGTTTTLAKGGLFRPTSKFIYDINTEDYIVIAYTNAPLYDEIFYIRAEDLKAIRAAQVVSSSPSVDAESVVHETSHEGSTPSTGVVSESTRTISISTEWANTGVLVMPGQRLEWEGLNSHAEIDQIHFCTGKPVGGDADPRVRAVGANGPDGPGAVGMSTTSYNPHKQTVWAKSTGAPVTVRLTVRPADL